MVVGILRLYKLYCHEPTAFVYLAQFEQGLSMLLRETRRMSHSGEGWGTNYNGRQDTSVSISGPSEQRLPPREQDDEEPLSRRDEWVWQTRSETECELESVRSVAEVGLAR